uniref:ATP-dependent DNA helicase n=1 Tax=Astatotilapia calliptera TaxID=8154 RepID=A0AAX7UK93_ASTCA
MCLLDLHTAVSVIIHHKNYFVVVDCGTRNAAGLASEIGTAVAVFNTCLDDLMLHIRNLQTSLDAQWYAVSSISVQAGQVDVDVESSAVFVDRDVDTNLTAKVDNTSVNLETVNAVTGVGTEDSCCIIKSVRGSFHQADDRFKYGGVQCMAIGLVSLAKHKVDSVFSWETKVLDRVVVLGDLLYTNLRDGNTISNSSSVLCVPDLPKKYCIDGQNFEFEYGDFVSGDVDVLEGELIESGVYTTLQTGLQKICAMYNTCLLTLCGSTCAVISENGQYALVDSHARSAVGLVSEQGRSVVLCFRSLEDVVRHICQLATGLSQKQKPFEVAGVYVRYLMVSDSATPKDSCEKTCKTFTLESSCDSIQNEPNISDVIIVESLIEAESCKTSGKTLSCSEYNLGLLCNDATRKRKISVGHSEAKKLKQYDVSQVNSDVEFVSEVTNNKLVFSPISEWVCQALCTQLNVEFEKISVPASTCVGLLGVPCKNESIVADGNCFFRAISQVVTGTQKHHRKIRLAIVKELERNAAIYRNILRSEYSTVADYIQKSKMRNVNSWATEVEIQATANCLGVDVFTFHDERWLKYGCNGKLLSEKGIYLENRHGNHYETVVCVLKPQLQTCYGYCKISASVIKGYSTRLKSKDSFFFDKTQDHTFCADEVVLDTHADGEVLNDASQFSFSPISNGVAQSLCYKFNVDFQKQDNKVHTVYGHLGVVCKTNKVIEDSNSFFRALSEVISGSEKSHRKIRLAVLKYMENNGEEHMKFVVKDYVSISEYISKSQMKYVGNPATDTEFQAAANAFGLDIFMFNGDKWHKYSCTSTDTTNEGIYLKCENSHFVPVICVQHFNKEGCFGLCRATNLSTPQHMCRGKTKEAMKDTLNICSSSTKHMVSKHSKKKKYFKNQIAYQVNALHKEKVKARSIKKYQKDLLHRQKVKEISTWKYEQNVSHKEKVKEMSIRKYKQNVSHKEKVKEMSIRKYKQNVSHKEKVKEMSIGKYKQNVSHKEKLKEISIRKYKLNELHRQNLKAVSFKKYHGNLEYKRRAIAGVSLKRQQRKEKGEQFDFVMTNFLDKIKDGPDFVCCVCHRLLFRHQVLHCKKNYYNKTKTAALIAEKCLTEDYLHKCNKDCTNPCHWLETVKAKLWICYTCHYKINKNEVPPESVKNHLEVHPIPPELACLNSLEQHLIALHIPFMKMLALPKGGQNGVHGPVTCVPANIVETTNVLPRSSMEGSLLPVKLKRKLTYKGHYQYQFVDTIHIRQALQYLKGSNVHYKDVEFNKSWQNQFCMHQEEAVEEESDKNAVSGVISSNVDDELLHDRQQHCMFQDTCLMPVDIGQEALDQYFTNILNLAPAEGNNPVKLLSDHANEAKCFPVLFPKGVNTYHENREKRLTLSRYFNNRILHADGRFAQNVEYIFFAQYMSEIEQVISNVSIALRKGKGDCTYQNVSHELLKDEESLKKLLEFDDGYRFLKPIRGTPAFWQAAQRDLLACVRQLGIPTWFCSFSSADMRWTNLLYSILKQQGRTETVEQLEWADRCDLLRRNPVTAARMFDFRWHCFLKEVLMSPLHPIGKIKDYFYRVEFQQRGSPHVHCLFWIENAPQIDKNTDEEVIQFIDEYVTCELPSQDETLLDIVSSVQQHSKRHSKTCKKKNTVCRFNFPRPPSSRTFICRRKSDVSEQKCKCQVDKREDDLQQCACESQRQQDSIKMRRKQASDILTTIKKALSDESRSFESVEHLFQSLGMNQATFEEAYKCFSRNTHVVLKRKLNEVWINQYNKPLLKCYNANLDIQFVIDAYACCVYIISYMSKSEKEMGLLLSNTQKEAYKDGNVSAREALKSLGSVYLHNRDVSAQEAVYRLTNMHLKECSRKVVFVPTGDSVVKMSLPLKVLRQKATSQDLTAEDMWMTSIVDRYKNRPKNIDFNDMCMATFASEYRVLSKSEKSTKPIQLNNRCGFVTKRTRSQPAVVRYARFSETKNAELFYHSIMQLFLPYRVDQELKPSNYTTFEQFYKNGVVKFSDGFLHSVKSVVDANRRKFEINADKLDNIQNTIDLDGVTEDAWCELCPEQELERLECEQEWKDKEQIGEEDNENIPDLAVCSQQVSHLEKRNDIMPRRDGLALIRSLNETQLSVFYQIRQWCLDKTVGKNPDPLHVFITGGAGTGKSHLIKAIHYEAARLLSPMCRHPENVCVLLTAPTGIAAYNLHATTIHNTFSIGKDVRLPYTPLGEEKLNCLRAKYCDLQILIIDEISMVDQRLMAYIHGRLRQIKQIGDFSPFGNVSVITVGDFFQLPPVKGKPLYVEDVGMNLWSSLFRVVELNKIVRQSDVGFAELLNRLRTHIKGAPLLEKDIKSLKHCETGEVSSALHIFPTNKQVNEHNMQQLFKLCPDYVEIPAQDFVNSKKTGKLELKTGHHAKTYNTCLNEKLLLGKGARVMLCKNVDVMDGLVNGVCGTVTHIVYVTEDKKLPKTIYVKFDDNHIGAQRRKNCVYYPAVEIGSTGIEAEEEKVTEKGGLRRQFPLKLAWACTVHKVQGVTVDDAVVSLKNVFAPGQAYVALSRVRSLSGLIIQDFNEKAIYSKGGVKDVIERMPQFLSENTACTKTRDFTVVLMNVQNLTLHVADLVLCTQHLQPNCIAVTETWMSADSSLDTVKIDGYGFQHNPRSASYTRSNPTFIEIQSQQHGGVGMYTADSLTSEIIAIPDANLECLLCNYCTLNILIAVIYRPPSYTMALFKQNLGKLLDWLDKKSNTVVVMGDFNDNVLKSSSICKFVTDKGFIQHVTQPTTEKGTLIDHVYVKTTHYNVKAVVFPTYFSDHEGIFCTFKSKTPT